MKDMKVIKEFQSKWISMLDKEITERFNEIERLKEMRNSIVDMI